MQQSLIISRDHSSMENCKTAQESLEIAIKISEILHDLHQNRVIHKDIKPANILINPLTAQVKLIDFGIASLLSKENQETQNPNVLEGTLAYLAPEQTGRMNRGLDYRTDFYSLGVTFYQLFTGQLPFDSVDPLELVHCHIAKNPVPPHEIQPLIPPVLSAIILKLMAKNAEDRYQNALGLRYDLEQVLIQWQSQDTIVNFELALRDTCDRFLIPEKLYGREKEVQILLHAFDRATNGKAEILLVSGFSGIGKTSVVHEIHKPITRQQGYFIKGKFDQFKRNIPLSAFVQGLRDLMVQLLAEPNAELARWRKRILEALTDYGQVLIEVIPELEQVIGKQPQPPEMSGMAAQNRFNLLFQKFIGVFTLPEHPLVIFLDDLQWADAGSLQLIKLLMEDRSYLLMLGAYRDNEVSPIHPFITTMEELKAQKKTVNTIFLAPLSLEDTNHLIADTLHCPPDRSYPLTELIHRKTQGNPFFVTQFLRALHDDGYIKFNRSEAYWECDIMQVSALSLTSDVVDFMAQQLQKLPPETQKVLKLAACIGNQFDVETLTIVAQQSKAETSEALWKALQEGLLLTHSNVYKFYWIQEEGEAPGSNGEKITYRFLHDRVQQAAYSLIEDDLKPITHYTIGKLLLQKTPPEAREDHIFELVNQLNYGVDFIESQKEQDELAELNWMACRKATFATAYASAQEYANQGIRFLGDDCWERQYTLSLGLYEIAAEVAAICGEFETLNRFIKAVISHSKTSLDQVGIYLVQIQALTIQNKFLEAVACGELILKQLGVTFPMPVTFEVLQETIAEIKSLIGDREIGDLLNLPPMTDPQQLAIMKIASRIVPACFLGKSPLFPLMGSLQVKVSLLHGNCGLSSTGYADYAIFIFHVQKDMAGATQFAQLAYDLALRDKDKGVRAVTFVPVGLYLYHHKAHLRETVGILKAGYEAALETGKVEYIGHNGHGFSINSYWLGHPLVELETQIKAYCDGMEKYNLSVARNYCLIPWETSVFLLGNPQDLPLTFLSLTGEAAETFEQDNGNDITRIAYLYLHRAHLNFLLRDLPNALEDITKARKYIEGILVTTCEAVLYFYDSLILLGAVSTALIEAATVEERIAENQTALQWWAEYAPMNYHHKWLLVEAERQRCLGHSWEALELYDEAIAAAKAAGYTMEEALANELAARFYLTWGKERVAAGYMQEAYYGYSRWGAKAKVEDLEQQYPQLLMAILRPSGSLVSSHATIISTGGASSNVWLDLPAVIRATQAMSQEIELNKLLEILMQIVITNAGAERGHLILNQEEEWLVVFQADRENMHSLAIPLDQYSHLPQGLIYSVIRTQDTVVFEDLSLVSRFASDRYVKTTHPKSVICAPISHQGKLVGVLYLENNLTLGAFTVDRLEILRLLVGQAAISIDNARLYQKTENYSQMLEEEVDRKTQALNQKAQDLEQILKKLQQTQAQLIQTEKMSSLGQLVAGIAHEINNPVNFIHGNLTHTQAYVWDLLSLVDLYQQEYPDPTPVIQDKLEEIEMDFLRRDIAKILDSMGIGCDRISQIVLSLRNFSRLDEAEIKPVDIHHGLDSTLLILQHRLKGNGLEPEIQVVYDYGELPVVRCYASALNQVFMNLMTNAIDALRPPKDQDLPPVPNPQITIKTQIDPQNNLIITIGDNGIGIEAAVIDKIFDPFFSTKPVGSGTGLGLSISYSIVVDQHHGQLTCRSTPGQGTAFTIKIPL